MDSAVASVTCSRCCQCSLEPQCQSDTPPTHCHSSPLHLSFLPSFSSSYLSTFLLPFIPCSPFSCSSLSSHSYISLSSCFLFLLHFRSRITQNCCLFFFNLLLLLLLHRLIFSSSFLSIFYTHYLLLPPPHPLLTLPHLSLLLLLSLLILSQQSQPLYFISRFSSSSFSFSYALR